MTGIIWSAMSVKNVSPWNQNCLIWKKINSNALHFEKEYSIQQINLWAQIKVFTIKTPSSFCKRINIRTYLVSGNPQSIINTIFITFKLDKYSYYK